MTLSQQIIIVLMCVLGTMATRFLPFIIFRENRDTPDFVKYIGKYLPSAVFGMLIIYCLRNVDFLGGAHGMPELIAIAVTVAVHLFKRRMLLSILLGTGCYMLLLRFMV